MNVISKYYGVSHRDEHGPASLGLEDIRLHWEGKKKMGIEKVKHQGLENTCQSTAPLHTVLPTSKADRIRPIKAN